MTPNPNKTQLLTLDIVRELALHWSDWGEPMPLFMLQMRFSPYWCRYNPGLSFASYWLKLVELGVFHCVRARTGRRWIFVQDIWDSLSDAERATWQARCTDPQDPLWAEYNFRRFRPKVKA